MSELTFATSGGVQREFELNVDNPSVKAGAAVFFEIVREVEEKDTQDGAHPIEVKAWVLDGPQAGTYEDSLWIFPKGMREKIGDKTPGAKSAGRLEIYKGRGNREFVGLTTLTTEQMELAKAKNEELKTGGSETKPASGGTAKADDAPPFHNGFPGMRPGVTDEVPLVI